MAFGPNSNGSGQEPLSYEDVLSYYQQLTMNLHGEVANARAMIMNRDRAIESLRSQLAEIVRENDELKAQHQEA